MQNELVIRSVKYNNEDLSNLKNKMSHDLDEKRVIFKFPTVYIIISDLGKKGYEAYVGETNSIERRTMQHLNNDVLNREDFKRLANSDSNMLVIGHNHFNKSITLDVENRMILYLLSASNITRLDNRRTNDQSMYYTQNEFEPIFKDIWQKLHNEHPDIFPLESEIINSAIYKSSPFHRLNNEQFSTEYQIENRINHILSNYHDAEKGELILVEGDAGTGKTVLLSSIFNKLNTNELGTITEHPKAYILVNQKQQLMVYQDIAAKLGLDVLENKIETKHGFKKDKIANNPATFITNHSPNEKVDVVLVDEAHLLWTQGIQSYQGKNELDDLLHRAKVVVAILDPNQVINNRAYIETKDITNMESETRAKHNLIHLNEQMRIKAGKKTIQWLNDFIFNETIDDIPDDDNYELRVSITPYHVLEAIKSHNNKRENSVYGLSRMIATFDWPYKYKPKEDGTYWNVEFNNFKMPWNLQLPQTKNSSAPWVEIPQSINEIGSSFTIQGFDLNYAGLIIGPSVQFRNGRVEIHPEFCKDRTITQKRTLSDNKKHDISNQLIRNSLNVLMKRGIHGLFIYAVDDALRDELIKKSGIDHIM